MLVQSLGREDPWRRARQPTPAFLPGESHGQRSLVGYSPWSHKESDTTEATELICNASITLFLLPAFLLINVYCSLEKESSFSLVF